VVERKVTMIMIELRWFNSHPRRAALLCTSIKRFTMMILLSGFKQAAN